MLKDRAEPIFGSDPVEGDHANQTDGTRLVELIEKIDTQSLSVMPVGSLSRADKGRYDIPSEMAIESRAGLRGRSPSHATAINLS